MFANPAEESCDTFVLFFSSYLSAVCTALYHINRSTLRLQAGGKEGKKEKMTLYVF